MMLFSLGRHPRGSFTPKQVPGLTLWLDAGRGVLLNGTAVSAWADQGGKGIIAAQGTELLQPSYAPQAVNGRPAVTFGGTHCLSAGNVLGTDEMLTAAAVFRFTDYAGGAGNNPTILSKGYSSQGSYALAGRQSSGKLQLWADAVLYHADANPPAGTGWLLAVTRLAPGPDGAAIRLNRAPYAAYTASGDFAGSNSYCLEIGRNHQDALYYFRGSIAEVAAYNRPLSEAEIRKLEHYFSVKYAI